MTGAWTEISALRFFRGANDEARRILERTRLNHRTVCAGDHLFAAGDAADKIFGLLPARPARDELRLDPLVQVELAPRGELPPLRLPRIVEGDIFGELEFLRSGLEAEPGARVTSARALTPATLLQLPVSLFSELVATDAGLLKRLIRLSADRLISSLRQQQERLGAHPDLILADWLVEVAAESGIAEGNRVSIARKLPQTEIAADLGVSRETISRRLNEWERSGLIRTGAGSQRIDILDYQRVSRLASFCAGLSRDALNRSVADIDEAIAAGDLVRARNTGLDLLRYYPSSPELHHRIALASARGGDFDNALDDLTRSGFLQDDDLSALSELVSRARRNPFTGMEKLRRDAFIESGFNEDDQDIRMDDADDDNLGRQLVEDIAALRARILKEQALSAPSGRERRRKATAAFESYRSVFEHTGGYYAGINAAAMALISGDRPTAVQIADAVAKPLVLDGSGYWEAATLAESFLIRGDIAEAKRALQYASTASGHNEGAKASTTLQFRRLCDALEQEPDELLRHLARRTVCVFSGHMFRGAEMDLAQQLEAEREIRRIAREIMTRHDIGHAFGALACGSDIILAELAVEQGADFHAVLPFASGRFIDTSVKIGDPPDRPGLWESRFHAVAKRAASMTVLEPSEPPARDLDGCYFHAFRHAGGAALLRAHALETVCRLIVVSDLTESENVAGTNRALEDWTDRGRHHDVVQFAQTRQSRKGSPRAASGFAPVIFIWSADPLYDQAFLDWLKIVAGDDEAVLRTSREGRRGGCLVQRSVDHALHRARTVLQASQEVTLPIRIACDFGIVRNASSAPDKQLIGRLSAADDLPGMPARRLLATESFAMQAKFEMGDAIALIPIARLDGFARSRPTVPIYHLEGSVPKPSGGQENAD